MRKIDNSYALDKHQSMNRIRWIVELYEYNTLIKSDMCRYLCDVSDDIISVSYDCDSSSHIKMSASLTLFVPEENKKWYMRKEHEIPICFNGQNGSPLQWRNVLYRLREEFQYGGEHGLTRIREYGYFIPDNNSMTFDTTTNQMTLQLQGMAAGFTAEYGGSIVAPIRTFDYVFYKNGEFSSMIKHYEVEEKKTSTDITGSDTASQGGSANINEKKTKVKQKSSVTTLTQVSENKDKIRGQGGKTGTGSKLNVSIGEEKEINVPLPITIDNVKGDPDPYTGEQKMIYYYNFSLLYQIATMQCDWQLNKWKYPIKGFNGTNFMDSHILTSPLEFDENVTIMDILEKFLDMTLKGYMLWVDEERRLNIDYRRRTRGECRMTFASYGDLVVDEDTSFSDGDFYTATEVYGKDNESYGFFDASGIYNIARFDKTIKHFVNRKFGEQRKQTIVDNSIETDEEAYKRAVYETYRSTRGHETVTVKLRDDWIPAMGFPSLTVGYPVEYRTMEGETNMMILEKASLSDNVWTFTMTYFHDDDSTFDAFSNGRYLKQPIIYNCSIINGDTARLYITGDDVSRAKCCRIYSGNSNENETVYYNIAGFLGETVNRLGNGDFYFDFKIPSTGVYSFMAVLYHPAIDEFRGSNRFTVALSPTVKAIPDPYKPDIKPAEEHKPYLVIPIGIHLTDENGNRLTL